VAALKLLTRADDFGASPGTNEAIIACLRAGFIRNAGIMAPTVHLNHQFDALKELADEACLGLHATLNSEWEDVRWGPVSGPAKVPNLVQADGTFLQNPVMTHELGSLDEIMTEIAAQLEKVRKMGVSPVYLDAHMGFYWIPGLIERLRVLCEKEGLILDHDRGFEGLGLKFMEEKVTPATLLDRAREEQATRSICVFHPARRDSVTERFFVKGKPPSDSVCREREAEFKLLTDPEWVRPFQNSEEIQLCRYDEI